jgi:formylmethanofuran dehydrogenase subunit E
MLKTLEHYLQQASRNGHTKSGIVLGIRMALLGLKELGIQDPRQHRHELVVVVETDRCLPDAVELVTGCRLGNRTLKFKDMGKLAATFVDLRTDRAARLCANESVNRSAFGMLAEMQKEEALAKCYMTLPDAELFTIQFVRATISEEDRPGYSAPRVVCAECGESIAFSKEIAAGGRKICRSCAGDRYFELL